jgi:flagellar operon protein
MTGVFHNPALVPPGVAGPAPAQQAGTPADNPLTQGVRGPSFDELLRKRVGGVHFSKHAVQRLERRNIHVDPSTMARLDAGVQRAAAKGARDSVVFVDSTAFVVSVQNQTVVTAVDREHMREHVFTNIDSAVIA